jgi:hypothetical protein
MTDSIRFFVGLSLVILIASSGCGPASSEAEMGAAREAMGKARSFSAEELATSDWNEAMEAWEEGQAAVEQGKPAKTHFLTAKSRFEKTAQIAKSHHDRILEDVSKMRQTISERAERIQTALDGKQVSSKVRGEIAPILAEVEEGSQSIKELLEQGSLMKAGDTAREIQKKVYGAELILQGKEPAS